MLKKPIWCIRSSSFHSAPHSWPFFLYCGDLFCLLSLLFILLLSLQYLSHDIFVLLSFCFLVLIPPSNDTHIQLSNGFDHYSPASSPYLHSNGGSSGSATAFPFSPATSSSSTSTSSPTRSWSRPASALLPDYPPYCTLGPMIPSSKVPSWKVCSSPQSIVNPTCKPYFYLKVPKKFTLPIFFSNNNMCCICVGSLNSPEMKV